MRLPPPAVIESWPKPNYNDPESMVATMLAVELPFTAVMCLVILVRIYTRLRISKCWGLDDLFIILSALGAIGYTVTACVATKHGWGIHIWDVRVNQIVTARISAVISEVFILLSTASLKISILCLYQRLGFKPWNRHILKILFTIVALWTTSEALATFLQCIPLHDYWDLKNSSNSICVDDTAFLVTYATINMALDIVLYLIPFPVLWHMQLPRKQKTVLAATLSIGGIAVIASGIRIPYLTRTATSYDLTWDVASFSMWTVIEVTLGIICASLPALRPLAGKALDRFSTRASAGLESSHKLSRYPGRIKKSYEISIVSTPAPVKNEYEPNMF